MDSTEIGPGGRIKGLIPGESVQIAMIQAIGNDAPEAAFCKNSGAPDRQIGHADALGNLSPKTGDLPRKFNAGAARGKSNARLNADRCTDRTNSLEPRLKHRLDELALERNIVSKPPISWAGPG